MEARATAKHVRISARKVRQIVDLIRGKDVVESLNALQFMKRAAKVPVEKTLRSAVANVFNNSPDAAHLEPSDLYIKEAFVDEGPTMKRFRPRAMGRATMIRKRSSHITIVVGAKTDK
ncbi:50S ribosomal protein L22 [bacterium]|nr:50S ribosomal protein L22 [bacterium]